MHHDELWQVYAKNGEPIEGEVWDSALGNPEVSGSDKIVGIAIVFLYRFNEQGELEFLWQRRSEKVDRYPGDYDISAGGHINVGESRTEAAVREVREEIGVEINEDDLQFVIEAPFNRNRFAWVYATDFSGRGGEFKFNDGEVSEVKWVSYKGMREFVKTYAKKPLKEDEFTFATLGNWLKLQGLIGGEDGNL
ncbi:NUDIX domain-containing protein [Candidatus Saccharibacteria bacterium]|nr:NUDIX domain-containing protein [Candidatus Saccharibacteria bacterium]MBR3122256.1 NUDIX domain-containing protein [Candidatus Saccharibacteria bacterium]